MSIKNSYIENGGENLFAVIGGVAGTANSIVNCHNINTIVKNESENLFGGSIGGVIGNVNQRTSKVEKCTNSGEVIGKENVGGVEGASLFSGELIGCINTGKVTGRGRLVGGITGQIGTNCEANIRNCYNEGEIIGSDSSIGGIVGWTSVTGTSGTIENNYNKGIVKGVTSVGGIIGRNAETFIVTKCYNKGTVEGTTNIGSVIGEQSGKSDNISKLYYLSTLNIGGVNGEDILNKDIIGVSDNINSYDDFLRWIEKK